jgi:hypothetical protein
MKLSNKYPLSYFAQGGKVHSQAGPFAKIAHRAISYARSSPWGKAGMGVSNNKTKSKIVIV